MARIPTLCCKLKSKPVRQRWLPQLNPERVYRVIERTAPASKPPALFDGPAQLAGAVAKFTRFPRRAAFLRKACAFLKKFKKMTDNTNVKFVATIYRTVAGCGIKGKPSRSIRGALDSARVTAGRMFVLGLCCPTGERFGTDKSQFLEEAEGYCLAAMRRRIGRTTRFSVRDNASDCTLEIERI